MRTRVLIAAGIAGVVVLVAVALTQRRADPDRSKTAVNVLLDWKMVAPYAPYVLAQAEGYYSDEGLQVTFTEGQGAETSNRLIGQGTYPLGTSNAAATASAIDKGVPILSVAVVERAPVTAIFSLQSRGITRPEHLLGRRLGVRHFDISHKEYLGMMAAQGLDPDDVREIGVGFEMQPLLTGQVDALYNYAYNMPVQLRQQGHDLNVILVKDWGVEGYGSNIVANAAFARSSPEVVRGFLRASQRGWEMARANPGRAISALRARNPQIDSAAAHASLVAQLEWVFPDENTIFRQSDLQWRNALAAYRNLGIVEEAMLPADVFTNAYLSEAAK